MSSGKWVKKLDIKERLISKIVNDSGCWLWIGPYDYGGYGKINIDRRTVSTHRTSYEAFVGPIPTGMSVLHKCDKPACINPEHLFLGTQLDNMRDARRKGRTRSTFGIETRGENNRAARLSESDVLKIRRASGIYDEIAQVFGVSGSTVSRIKRGKIWRHL